MKSTERDIHLRMIQTLCNMVSAHSGGLKLPGEIEQMVREIAIRELSEAQKEPK